MSTCTSSGLGLTHIISMEKITTPLARDKQVFLYRLFQSLFKHFVFLLRMDVIYSFKSYLSTDSVSLFLWLHTGSDRSNVIAMEKLTENYPITNLAQANKLFDAMEVVWQDDEGKANSDMDA